MKHIIKVLLWIVRLMIYVNQNSEYKLSVRCFWNR